jgi:hypothetical protein
LIENIKSKQRKKKKPKHYRGEQKNQKLRKPENKITEKTEP